MFLCVFILAQVNFDGKKKTKIDKEVKEIPTKGLYKIIIKVFFLALNENSLKRVLNYIISTASYLS